MKTLLTSCSLALVLAFSPQAFAAVDKAKDSDLVHSALIMKDGSKVHIVTTRADAKKLEKDPKGLEASVNFHEELKGQHEKATETDDSGL